MSCIQSLFSKNKQHKRSHVHNFGFLAVLDLFRGHVLQHTTIQTKVTGFSFSIVHVESGQLNKGHTKEDLEVDTPANLADGTEDVLVGVSFTGEVNAQLLDNNTNNGQHADAAVLDFSPTSIVQVGLDVGTVSQ